MGLLLVMKSKTGIIWNTNKSKIVIKEDLDDNILNYMQSYCNSFQARRMVKVKLTSLIGQVISKQVVLDVEVRLMTIYCYDRFLNMASWEAPTW